MKTLFRNYGAIILATVVAIALIVTAALFSFEPWQTKQAHNAVKVKSALNEYSWNELSLIASEISSCKSQDEAMTCAKKYHICNSDGSLDGTQTKTVSLSGGIESNVVLADIWHDARTDGGKAGLTFAFNEPVGLHSMNHSFENDDGGDADSVGGWGSSDMRQWLNGDFIYTLPHDLRSHIVEVQKTSASAVGSDDELDDPGHLGGTGSDWAAETSDKVWLLSAAELCGEIPAESTLGIDSTMASVYSSEGTQYRLFKNYGVAAFSAHEFLMMPNTSGSAEGDYCTWWLRTKTLEFGDGFWLVGTDGTPLNGLGEDARALDSSFAPDELWGPDHARAVVPAFCL